MVMHIKFHLRYIGALFLRHFINLGYILFSVPPPLDANLPPPFLPHPASPSFPSLLLTYSIPLNPYFSCFVPPFCPCSLFISFTSLPPYPTLLPFTHIPSVSFFLSFSVSPFPLFPFLYPRYASPASCLLPLSISLLAHPSLSLFVLPLTPPSSLPCFTSIPLLHSTAPPSLHHAHSTSYFLLPLFSPYPPSLSLDPSMPPLLPPFPMSLPLASPIATSPSLLLPPSLALSLPSSYARFSFFLPLPATLLSPFLLSHSPLFLFPSPALPYSLPTSCPCSITLLSLLLTPSFLRQPSPPLPISSLSSLLLAPSPPIILSIPLLSLDPTPSLSHSISPFPIPSGPRAPIPSTPYCNTRGFR